MSSSAYDLNAAEAAARLGISAKALRLYEQRGLLLPARSAAGWRSYSPADMVRAGEIVSLRALGLSLAQVERVLQGHPQGLELALAGHQTRLEDEARRIADDRPSPRHPHRPGQWTSTQRAGTYPTRQTLSRGLRSVSPPLALGR